MDEKNIQRYSIKKIYETVTIFYLGGISNLLSRRSLTMKLNTGILSILKEFIKFLLLKLLGQKSFIKLFIFLNMIK